MEVTINAPIILLVILFALAIVSSAICAIFGQRGHTAEKQNRACGGFWIVALISFIAFLFFGGYFVYALKGVVDHILKGM